LWKEFHNPLVLDGRLTVRPPWEEKAQTPLDIVIDPGQAFGTGAHATTRLCLELMLELESMDGFLDLGCGSGVLAITAAALGFAPVLALDNDPAAVRATVENAAVNGVEIEVRRADLRTDPIMPLPTIAANLLSPMLIKWAAELRQAPHLPDRVIASGVLVHEADAVAAAFSAVGLVERERQTRGEWAALLLVRM
jgi:ribosomal protein L11 methyltransferase